MSCFLRQAALIPASEEIVLEAGSMQRIVRTIAMDIKPMDLTSPDRSGSRRMLRLQQVIEKTGLGKTTIYQMQKSASFPHSVPMTSRSVRWIEAEVDAWVAQRAYLRMPQEKKD